jgi:hypothetical protein
VDFGIIIELLLGNTSFFTDFLDPISDPLYQQFVLAMPHWRAMVNKKVLKINDIFVILPSSMGTVSQEVIEFHHYLSEQDGSSTRVSLNLLPLDCLTAIVFLLKNYYNPNTRDYNPLLDVENVVKPDYALLEKALIHLIQNGHIKLSPRNAIVTLTRFHEEHGPLFFFMMKNYQSNHLGFVDSLLVTIRSLRWVSNLDMQQIQRCLLEGPDSLSTYSEEEFIEYATDLAVNECSEYVRFSALQIFNFQMMITYELIVHFRKLLLTLTTSQILKLVYQSSNFYLRLMKDRQLPKENFQALFTKTFIEYSERALTEKWTIKAYEQRLKLLPKSELNKVFHTNITNVSYDSFNRLVTMILKDR